MLSATDSFMESEYKRLYESYSEGDTTTYTIQTFFDMRPSASMEYLEYGCGKWSKTIPLLNKRGYKVRGYDMYVKPDHDLLVLNPLCMKFDGIFSHNVIEHLRDPIATLQELSKLLNPGGKMAHSTACYDYACAESQFHLFFFTGRSVEELCKKTGLFLLERKTYLDYKCCIFSKENDKT
jgi:SAM-dependent methyltransferase